MDPLTWVLIVLMIMLLAFALFTKEGIFCIVAAAALVLALVNEFYLQPKIRLEHNNTFLQR